MANEISVRSRYTYQDEDGTVYNSDYSYYSDATATASAPKRYVFYANSSEESILGTGATSAFIQGLQGSGILMIVNRSPGVDMQVRTASTGVTNGISRLLKPKECMIMDVMEQDEVTPGGGSFTYGSNPVTNVYVKTELKEAKGELLFIAKSSS